MRARAWEPAPLFDAEDVGVLLRAALLLRDLGYLRSGRPDDIERIAHRIREASTPTVAAAITKARQSEAKAALRRTKAVSGKVRP